MAKPEHTLCLLALAKRRARTRERVPQDHALGELVLLADVALALLGDAGLAASLRLLAGTVRSLDVHPIGPAGLLGGLAVVEAALLSLGQLTNFGSHWIVCLMF